MSLHGWWQVLYLCHQDYVSEHSEVLLNLSKDPLSLSGWKVPCYYCSPSGGSHGLWPWMTPIPCIVGRSHGSHICIQYTFTHQLLWHTKKMIYITKRHKNYICKQKKLQRWRLTHLPSLLTRRHGYLWIPRKVYPCIWVVLDRRDLS
jgi:hypothetical protein